jgi:hypothetical protein
VGGFTGGSGIFLTDNGRVRGYPLRPKRNGGIQAGVDRMGKVFARRVQLVLLVALAGWTGYWAVTGYAFLQQESIVMQQGFGDDGIQLWELFNIQMLAAHYVVRWLPGALLLLGGVYLVRRALRPDHAGTAARRPAPLSTVQEAS